ncbi:MAG: M28 family metallopeptidase [Solirubrobacterales bacterium]
MPAARATIAVLTMLAGVVAGCGGNADGDGGDLFDAERAYRDVEAQVAIGPRPSRSAGSRDEVAFIERELRAAGVQDVRVQRPHANVVGVIPGRGSGAVVIGAHHDTKDGIRGFVGANDGASGVAVVLELARILAAGAPLDGPPVHLALFDAEEARGDRPFPEDGTRGSRQYVEYGDAGGRQGSPPIQEIEAMVLFDLVGDCGLRVPLEAGSDPALYGRFAEAAEEARGDRAPFTGTTTAVGDDHTPFVEAGIPAVDLIDFAYGEGSPPGSYWHTAQDTLDKVCADSLDAVGEAAVRAIPELP